MSNTIIADIGAAFQESLKDGFQIEDILSTLEAGAKSAVRYAFDQLPGEGEGLSRKDLALTVLKGAWRTLVGSAREMLVVSLGVWMGNLFDIVRGKVEEWGDGLIEKVMGEWLDALLKWAYSTDKIEKLTGLVATA